MFLAVTMKIFILRIGRTFSCNVDVNVMLFQMSTKAVSYIYTRQSDIEDVDLLDVTLFNASG